MLLIRHPNGKEYRVSDRATFERFYARRGFSVVLDGEGGATAATPDATPAATPSATADAGRPRRRQTKRATQPAQTETEQETTE